MNEVGMIRLGVFAFTAGLWFGLLPYMLLRYRGCDLFGRGSYVTGDAP